LTGLKFTSIDAGAAHTCALTGAGEAYCWGRNDRGQLGDGTIVVRLAPALVSGCTFQQIAAGGFNIGHTCGLTATGQTYCWGDNETGQLGVGSADVLPHPTPLAVSTGVTFASITAGLGRHSCGRTALGTAYCWGQNSFGALGNGTQKGSAIPVEVAGTRTFSQLIAGGFIGHTCAFTGTGDAYCWGENETGQVGDGTTVDRLAPTAVVGGLIFTSIDAGFRHTCGRDNTGAVYCWGANGAGQLGNNTNSQSNVPSKVFGQPAVLSLQLNQTLFHPADTMVLTAMLTPGTDPALVDAYVVIQLPGGTFLSLQPVGAVPGIAPFVTGFTPPPFSGTIFSYQFTGAEPPGLYSWFAALTQTGTLNVVGSIDQNSFTFTP
jgi:alpha-tubulin suppressor-like RCC1 family protein